MSNVYILPRNHQQQQQRKLQQPPSHSSSLVGSGGQRKQLIAATAAHGTVVATRSRLVNNNNNRIAVAGGGGHHQQHRYLSSPYPPIHIRKPMLARRVILAPPQFQQPTRFEAPMPTATLVVDQQSEEDEFDVDEVYQLLEESAGHRLQDAAEAAMPRRRERLTNLTAEEKMNRRKQKNRIAAQAARDRRKETTKRLEDSLRRALLEIGRLKGEVKLLRAENERMCRDGSTERGEEAMIAAKCYYDEGEQAQPAMYYQPQQPTIRQRHPLVSSTNRPYPASIPQQHQHQYQQQSEARSGQKQAEGAATANQQQQKAKMATTMAAQQQPKSQPQQQQQQQPDSLGSAASFSGPLPRERESSSSSSCHSSDDGSSSKCPAVVQQCPMLTMAGTTKQQRQLRMACLMKVLMALWSIVCIRRERTSSCSKSSTSFSKSWTFQSMWTASATRSLRRALLRRMLRMDVAKLAALCNSPQQQLVAHFHHTVVANANRKARGRQRSLARCPAMVDLMLMEEEAEDGANSSMDIGQSIASTLMMASEEADGGEAVVPEALPTRR